MFLSLSYSSGLYSIADDDRYRHGVAGVIDPYLTYRRSREFSGWEVGFGGGRWLGREVGEGGTKHLCQCWYSISPPTLPLPLRLLTASEDYSEIHEPGNSPLGATISSRDMLLGDKIGEGQFGDVHKGVLYPNVSGQTTHALGLLPTRPSGLCQGCLVNWTSASLWAHSILLLCCTHV